MRFLWLILMSALLLSGCAHSIHEVHTSDFIPASAIESGEMVKGYGEQFVVMGFVTQTNYIDVAYKNLMAACPRGTLTGITTQISTSMGFFSWTNKALMQGLCLPTPKDRASLKDRLHQKEDYSRGS